MVGRTGCRGPHHYSGCDLTCCPSSSLPILPSILAHQVPNAKKLRRKEQLWEKLAKEGELPREVRKAQARLLNPPVAKSKPRPQDTVERPFYDLWTPDSKRSYCHLQTGQDCYVAHCPRAQ
jgi:hypothetical protein